eukprot:XP_014050265.1 PREDICTED: glutathione S-transferase C-terminal domain-containing protein-like [Salmo salar]
MVTELAGPGDTVEDFCSGGGHVGIILAHTLPDCQVILIENKEESLVRGKVRSAELGLTNIGFIQANLDYFTGPFHIGFPYVTGTMPPDSHAKDGPTQATVLQGPGVVGGEALRHWQPNNRRIKVP